LIEIKAQEIMIVPIEDLKPKTGNRNKHPESQLEELVTQYKYQGFRNPITVSNQSGEIVCGNGRYLAALRAGLQELPVIYQDYETMAQEYEHHVADNATGLQAELDFKGIREDIKNLDLDINVGNLSIEGLDLQMSRASLLDNSTYDTSETPTEYVDNKEENNYTRKIQAPIYEPKGDKPQTNELFDLEKTKELINQINNSNLDQNTKDFLTHAAYRHTKFNYEAIAEYYAHSDKETQELMENSALVIIDFDKAIENGFIKLTDDLKDAFLENEEIIQNEE